MQYLIINPSPPSAAYMRQWIVSIGSDNGLSPKRHQAISKPVLGYCQLDP